MKLRFYAREDVVATVPGAPLALGQHIHRIGRKHVPAKDGKPPMMPATEEGHEVDIDMDSPAGVQLFEKYRRIVSVDADVWCADAATAQAFGAELVPVEFKDGVWSRKAVERTASAKKDKGTQ